MGYRVWGEPDAWNMQGDEWVIGRKVPRCGCTIVGPILERYGPNEAMPTDEELASGSANEEGSEGSVRMTMVFLFGDVERERSRERGLDGDGWMEVSEDGNGGVW